MNEYSRIPTSAQDGMHNAFTIIIISLRLVIMNLFFINIILKSRDIHHCGGWQMGQCYCICTVQ